MKPLQITQSEAKSIVLRSQFLEGKQKGKSKSATLEVIKQLGYLQIDTISVVERAHHHILWTRQLNYTAKFLKQLQENDREIFEYWGHAAAYLPMEDIRFYQYKMQQFLNKNGQWFKNKLELCKTLMPSILKRIEHEGELSSKDFKSAPNKQNAGWWNWKPSKIALELLFWQGKLMISKRKGFQKVYDLPHRVVPNHINRTTPTNEEVCDYQIKKSLQALGLAREKDILYILRIAGKEDISTYLKKLIENKQLSQIQVGKLPSPYFALPEVMDQYAKSTLRNNKIHILSPFDNLIINRDRLK
ncbi:MAG: winged helix-turn-helix domain-containing protein, partial [Deltaproteobacteria bacterium]|nr:winged helix-turn-helix domain-containing protein [Deltaproteobacteria bacterium]